MLKNIDYRELRGKFILVDVRSPGEYEDATIPGAVNVPLLDNEERRIVGTIYVKESVEKAKRMGLELVGKKLPFLYDKIRELEKEHKNIVFFCARGGFRSVTISTLMASLGVNASKLMGGYKGYRKVVNEELPILNEEVTYVVLHGNTGVGKTEILKKLCQDGYEVLDLEGAANHRGSLLGSVGLGQPRSQKQFESLVYDTLRRRKSDIVFVEGESRRIGNIVIPSSIWERMEEGVHILVQAPLEFRANLILKEYMKKEGFEKEILFALDLLKKYMSEENIQRYEKMAVDKEYKELAEQLMVKYYDPLYASSEKKYEYNKKIEVNDIEKAAQDIESWMKLRFRASAAEAVT
ncbi:tRNA 2-selenouridine(34) synthase MnmH [Clostridium bovifaecis]|uniref:tRNA 2-selenouridine(34) synthase MnmH n=1 Tax=Clostridium bovifaecis TaxID=2184719 RepID=A0A6I6ELA9_9CLOT|nr:tRNA 2-selenouridine(34) synthase MnmH [Clostridium bovifaecis]